MVKIKKELIESIPVLELFDGNKEEAKLPLVIFYHGWESRKERVLEYGYALAQRGFRVVLPEAWNHGERKPNANPHEPLDFWEVVVQNVQELPILSTYYLEQKKTSEGKISVGGLSMGGVTVSAMLTQYDWLHSAVILMGSPAPIEFSEWLLKNYKIDGTPMFDLLDKENIQENLNKLKPISLALAPEKIAKRPVYFWHGEEDSTVPVHLTKQFLYAVQNEPYSINLTFELSEGVKHTVPREIVLKSSDFLKRTMDLKID